MQNHGALLKYVINVCGLLYIDDINIVNFDHGGTVY